jgi:hypothetical protein
MRTAELQDDYADERPLSPAKRRKIQIWVVIGAAALFGVGTIVNHIRAQWRSDAMARWAAANGFSFQSGGDDAQAIMSSQGFIYSGNGHSFSNASRGRVRGTDVLVFDYSANIGGLGRGRSHSYPHTAILLRPGQNIPAFDLWTLRYGATLDPQDIYLADYEHWPTSKYVLQPTGLDWRRPDNTQAIRDFLHRHGQDTQWRVRYAGGWLMLCHWNGTVSPARMNDFINDALAFADVLKSAW